MESNKLNAIREIFLVSVPLFDRCSQQQPYLPMDILVSFPLLNVAFSDILLRPWTFWCPSLS
jgi:hypothetical protein